MECLIEQLIGAGLSGLAGQLRTISLEDALRDYDTLKKTNCKVNNDTLRVGNKAMDYFFFAHRLRTRTRRGISFPEWLKTDEKNKPYFAKLINKQVKEGTALIKAQYKAFSIYSGSGTISAFKPIIVRRLYCMFNPKTVLDFSAGWGGRCLGAMSLNINYIGFDTNTTLKPAYKGMIETYPHSSKVNIHFRDSSKVDYSKYTYDMVFTSPPYFVKTAPTEQYKKMPEYKDKEDFNKRFFFPVVANTWEHLESGGVYALNIPIEMYNDIKQVLGNARKKFRLHLPSRGKLGGGYKEYIYIWYKN
jgi:16S rRNA G966 N2-methylase RsmD